jgi:3-hydroxybutyrate dehydrogenase
MTQSRIILLTGAGSGLGRGLAQIFAAQGHSLILADLNADGLNETLKLLGKDAERAATHVVNVTSSQQIQELFNALAGKRVDVLINNAGLQHVSPLEKFPEERWDLLMDVMLKGSFLMTQAALPLMRKNNFGRIINIGSIHALIASPFKSAYVAAKHGLMGLSKVVALESADADITINTICPAYVRTPLVDAQIAAQAKTHGISEDDVINKIMLEPMPKKAFITIEEVAGAVEFLMSPAARNITGQAIVMDGGWTAK